MSEICSDWDWNEQPTPSLEWHNPKNQMPNEVQNHNDHEDVKLNAYMALAADPVGIGFLTFIWDLDFII